LITQSNRESQAKVSLSQRLSKNHSGKNDTKCCHEEKLAPRLSGTVALKVMLASLALQAANALNPANFNLSNVSQAANSIFIASYCKLDGLISLEPLHNSQKHSGLSTIKSEKEITRMER
jgi:hypothetical protein